MITDALALAPALAGLATDGWARVGRRFDAAALAGLRARLDAIMDGVAPRDGLFFQHDAASGAYEDLALGRGWIGPSRAYRKLEGLERDPVVRVWLDDPGLAQLAHAVIGPEVQRANSAW